MCMHVDFTVFELLVFRMFMFYWICALLLGRLGGVTVWIIGNEHCRFLTSSQRRSRSHSQQIDSFKLVLWEFFNRSLISFVHWIHSVKPGGRLSTISSSKRTKIQSNLFHGTKAIGPENLK